MVLSYLTDADLHPLITAEGIAQDPAHAPIHHVRSDHVSVSCMKCTHGIYDLKILHQSSNLLPCHSFTGHY